MYPDFHYLISSLFGFEAPEWLGVFKTFGLFVALGFLFAAYVLQKDLKRKEEMGLLLPEFETIEVGKPASINELVLSAVIGFLLGFKIGGFYGHWQEISPNPMGYIFTLQGNFIAGIIGAVLFAYSKYAEKKKELLPEPKEKRIAIYPHQRLTEFIVIAMVGGLAGAKIFNAFETWDDFIRNPIENLIASSGLTFYGGLIVAGVSIVLYARKHKIPVKHLLDSFAPAMMLGYGIGRFGCHFAGDGDWGVFNSAYVTNIDTSLRLAAPGEFIKVLHGNLNYLSDLVHQFGSVQNIPHFYMPAPSWLPNWLFGMNYAYNVNNEGVPIVNALGQYHSVLPVSVFPTPLYEAITCILLFFFLWFIRKRMKYSLQLSGIYLIINGIERFLVETIRVNYKYDLGFIHPSQAEIISSCLVIAGILVLVFSKEKITPKVVEQYN